MPGYMSQYLSLDLSKYAPLEQNYHIFWLGLTIVVGGVLIRHLGHVIYLALLSPLAKVPGPLLCKFTSLPDTYQAVVRGRRSEWIHELHQQYGPIVRISPNLCSFSDPDELKKVYGGKFTKAVTRYRGKRIASVEHALIIEDLKEQKYRRSLLLPLFQKANLDAFGPDLEMYANQLIAQMQKDQDNAGCVDIFRWMRLAAFDIIGSLAYGQDMAMTQSGKLSTLVENMATVFFAAIVKDNLPLAARLMSTRAIPPLTKLYNAEKFFQNYGFNILREMQSSGELDNTDSVRPNLLKSLHQASVGHPAITKAHMITEAGAILIAGSDTTSTAMTYGCWELSRDADLQNRIREELRPAMPEPDSPPRLKDLEALPLFNAFLKEVLRRWPTLPGPLERTVPSEGTLLCGLFLPGGTDVTATAYTMHRDANIFVQGDRFMPERWFNETAEMRNAFIPFSTGARNCVGMNLAWAEMRLIMAMVIRRWEILPHPATTEVTMMPVEHFFVVPKSMKTVLVLKKVVQ